MDKIELASLKESIKNVEDALESLLELASDTELDEALCKGFTLNTREGMPTWIIKLVPSNLRDTMRIG